MGTTIESVVCWRSSSGQKSTSGAPATNAPMNSELMNAPKPCARVCGGITACATGRIGRDRADDAREPERAASTTVVGDRVGPPPHDREVEAEQQRRRQPDRARAAPSGTARPVRRPTSGVVHQRGERHQPRATARGRWRSSWKWPSSHRLNQSPQPRKPKPIARSTDRHVAQRRDLPEPRERVHGRESARRGCRRRRGRSPRLRRGPRRTSGRRPAANARTAASAAATKNGVRHSARAVEDGRARRRRAAGPTTKPAAPIAT